MFEKVKRNLKLNKKKLDYKNNNTSKKRQALSKDLTKNLNFVSSVLENCSDIVVRKFKIGADLKVEALLIMIDGLVDKIAVNESLLKSLMLDSRIANFDRGHSKDNIYTLVKECALSVSNVKEVNTVDDSVQHFICRYSFVYRRI